MQAAGRCNRNGGDEAKEKDVYVIPLKAENLERLYDIKNKKEKTAKIINENKGADFLSQEILNEFYKHYYDDRGELMDFPISKTGNTTIYSLLSENEVGRRNYKNRKNVDFSHLIAQAFTSAGENFKVIDNNTTAVVVYFGNVETLLLDYKKADLKNKISILQELQKYSVSLFSYEYEKLLEQGAITELDEEFGIKLLASFYYSNEYGVTTEVDVEKYIPD
ncbi:MAG: hypothetical protein PHH71_03735 [Clostridia bacterium]|nr:hypothetical protein [Clostridia bacterium]MDD3231801.1 hypothetical protein [Clostridia bacterium]MDD3862774.1 hypothetical protein [Clostridia bacterium]